MTYLEALAFLDGLRRHGMRPGLERMQRLLELSGHPERGLRFIHVAGTNGKGSTCALLESVYRVSGRRTGLFTSPHLVSFRERLQVGRECVSEADTARWIERAAGLLEGWTEDEQPTFFELVTWVALEWFREQACELVIWETGLGGRLDATNVVRPEATVITPIGWDHMEWLGHSLEAIAAEKAGILKPGVPAYTSTDDPAALAVLRETARTVGAPLEWVGAGHDEVARVRTWNLTLRGEHQRRNAALAVATVRGLQDRWPVTSEQVRVGIESARWAGRFEVRQRGRQTWVIDGAHNRPAFGVLTEALREQFGDRPYALILGMLADKELASAAPGLVAGAVRTVVVPVHSNRGCPPAELAAVLARHCPGARVEVAAGLREATERMASQALVVVAGSLFLVGEVLEWMEGGSFSERALNDWGRTR